MMRRCPWDGVVFIWFFNLPLLYPLCYNGQETGSGLWGGWMQEALFRKARAGNINRGKGYMNKTGKRILFGKILALAILTSLVLGVNGGCGRPAEPAAIRVGGLKGPTTIGLVFLQEWSVQGQASQTYTFTMAAAAEELLSLLVKEELDIALLPANVASVLYNKTEGGVTVIDVNTLGVLYLVSGDREITGPENLRGRTVYLTGKGTTPDYVLQYLLLSLIPI